MRKFFPVGRQVFNNSIFNLSWTNIKNTSFRNEIPKSVKKKKKKKEYVEKGMEKYA